MQAYSYEEIERHKEKTKLKARRGSKDFFYSATVIDLLVSFRLFARQKFDQLNIN